MAIGRQIVTAVIVDARFGIEQDRGQHGLHIAAHAGTVVGECGGHTRHICRARLARHQMLDQLLAHKWAHIRMIEDIVSSALSRSCCGVRPAGFRESAEEQDAWNPYRVPPDTAS